MTIVISVVLLFTLLGFFVKGGIALDMQRILVHWAVIIAAFAVLLGFFNVLAVHVNKLTSRAPGWFYSLALIISVALVIWVGLGELFVNPEEGLWGPGFASVFVWIIAPLQAATAALLFFILTFAAFRMLRHRRRGEVLLFITSVLVVLISQMPLPDLAGLEDLRDVWFSWLAIPGLRAVLIGVGLGIVMLALRLIMGIDRPQG